MVSKRHTVFSYMEKFPHASIQDVRDAFSDWSPNTVTTYRAQYLRGARKCDTPGRKPKPKTKKRVDKLEPVILPDDDPVRAIHDTCMRLLNVDDPRIQIKAANTILALLDKSGKLNLKTGRELEVENRLATMQPEDIVKIATSNRDRLPRRTRSGTLQGSE